eukprot:augustus_masked-scaffold_26-processed-gene-0.11-mRNA-1 protein AED:1.00 eAED:1.00 QI:0/-1/0/0/-1/1/1/0/224
MSVGGTVKKLSTGLLSAEEDKRWTKSKSRIQGVSLAAHVSKEIKKRYKITRVEEVNHFGSCTEKKYCATIVSKSEFNEVFDDARLKEKVIELRKVNVKFYWQFMSLKEFDFSTEIKKMFPSDFESLFVLFKKDKKSSSWKVAVELLDSRENSDFLSLIEGETAQKLSSKPKLIVKDENAIPEEKLDKANRNKIHEEMDNLAPEFIAEEVDDIEDLEEEIEHIDL